MLRGERPPGPEVRGAVHRLAAGGDWPMLLKISQ